MPISDLLIGIDKNTAIELLENLSTEKSVFVIVTTSMDFDLLERDDNGYVVYNGDLVIDRKDVSKLPENLKVMGDLRVNYSPQLKELPKGLYVGGDLECYECSIDKLPDNLYVGGNFDCSDNIIEELPKGLNVVGNFNCDNNLISEIPEDIYVGKMFSCKNNGTVKIPRNANIRGHIFGEYEEK